jgi:hypothetical protein
VSNYSANNRQRCAPTVHQRVFTHSGPIAVSRDRLLSADSVEKVDLLLGLRQNQVIGQREDSQHDGTIVEWTRETVLLVQH